MTTLATTADVERMTASLATKADLAALPTIATSRTVVETAVTLREAAVALSATVEAISDIVEAQRENTDTLSAVVTEYRETADMLGAVVEAHRETIDTLNAVVTEHREITDILGAVVEAAVRTDGVVGAPWDDRLDSLTTIVSPWWRASSIFIARRRESPVGARFDATAAPSRDLTRISCPTILVT